MNLQLMPFSPFRNWMRMDMGRDLDRFFDSDGKSSMIADSFMMDMYEQDGQLITEVTLPNFKKEEINITTDNGVLEITAEHKEEEEQKNKRNYFFRESSNQYSRRVMLPEGADANQIDAAFQDGVLKITMPIMKEKSEAKQVQIK